MNTLYSQYSDRGLEIIAFPSGQFLNQELSCDMDIKAFAENNDVKFTMMSKTDVNGDKESPVYSFLKAQPNCTGGIKWNFSSYFLIDRKGGVVKRFNGVKFINTASAIEECLAQSAE